MKTPAVINEITPQTLVELLQGSGWKALLAEVDGRPRITSAINGVNFHVRPVTRSAAGTGWTDFTLSAPFAIDQSVSPSLCANWNRKHRFARVYRTEKHVMLDMDVVVAGGVTNAHLSYQFALWADITNAFLQHLRNDREAAAKTAASRGDVKSRSAANSTSAGDAANAGERRRQSA